MAVRHPTWPMPRFSPHKSAAGIRRDLTKLAAGERAWLPTKCSDLLGFANDARDKLVTERALEVAGSPVLAHLRTRFAGRPRADSCSPESLALAIPIIDAGLRGHALVVFERRRPKDTEGEHA
jgi:hypothetical protein